MQNTNWTPHNRQIDTKIAILRSIIVRSPLQSLDSPVSIQRRKSYAYALHFIPCTPADNLANPLFRHRIWEVASTGDRKDHAGLTHAWRTMEAEVPEGWQAWVVVRRSLSDPKEVVYSRVCAPKQTTLQQIVEGAGQCWKVEEAIERAKEACGLDQYEGSSWTGW